MIYLKWHTSAIYRLSLHMSINSDGIIMTIYIVRQKPKNDLSGLRRVRIRQDIEIATVMVN